MAPELLLCPRKLLSLTGFVSLRGGPRNEAEGRRVRGRTRLYSHSLNRPAGSERDTPSTSNRKCKLKNNGRGGGGNKQPDRKNELGRKPNSIQGIQAQLSDTGKLKFRKCQHHHLRNCRSWVDGDLCPVTII